MSLFPDVPTLQEQNVDAVFANWRGFFAPPGIALDDINEYRSLLEDLVKVEGWQQLREARGWSSLHLSGTDFKQFLAMQEVDLSELLDELGLLEK